jgi:uroporphyrinogen decarboxylase
MEGLLTFLGIDFRFVPAPHGRYLGEARTFGGHPADYWGIPNKLGQGDSDNLRPLAHVASIDEVEAYVWPKATDFDLSHIRESAQSRRGQFAVGCVIHAPLFHNFTWLCGVENAFCLMIAEPDIAGAILRKVTDFWVDLAVRALEEGGGKIDLVVNHNDFGTQRGLIISPDTWRQLIKPQLTRLYEVIHHYGAHVYQHSCGSIVDIIPDLLMMGADILDPIQVTAEGMDPEKLAAHYGGKIVFHGGMDTQQILPFGTEAEVRQEVRRMIRILNGKGGYILCGSQTFTEEIPLSNILAVYDEARKVDGHFH